MKLGINNFVASIIFSCPSLHSWHLAWSDAILPLPGPPLLLPLSILDSTPPSRCGSGMMCMVLRASLFQPLGWQCFSLSPAQCWNRTTVGATISSVFGEICWGRSWPFSASRSTRRWGLMTVKNYLHLQITKTPLKLCPKIELHHDAWIIVIPFLASLWWNIQMVSLSQHHLNTVPNAFHFMNLLLVAFNYFFFGNKTNKVLLLIYLCSASSAFAY